METKTAGSDEESDQQLKKKKKMVKELRGRRDDTALHCAARAGRVWEVVDILTGTMSNEGMKKELVRKQNQFGETALYAAAENGQVEVIKELMNYYDPADASIKARNGYDPFLIAANQGDLEVLKVLMEADPNLSMTYDTCNTTALQAAATQGHIKVVSFLLESGSGLATICRSNGKNALHSAARNGHLEVVKALIDKDPGMAMRVDRKGQTALHMAVKGKNVELVDALVKANPSCVNLEDNKGNTALHVAARKGRSEIVRRLVEENEVDKYIINRVGETAVDTAEKMHQAEVAAYLQEKGLERARVMVKAQAAKPGMERQLKKTVSDIKHGVEHQLEHSRQTRKRVQRMAKRLNKMHAEGLNNAINSTTVVAVLIATVAFAAIFTVPGQYVVVAPRAGLSLGEANIAPNPAFLVFFVLDALALFISLAVVVVQTSVVVIQSRAKKKMMAIINKLMWLACVLISVAFLALSFVVVGKRHKPLAIAVAIIGTTIMVTTLGLMCYWVIHDRIHAANNTSNKHTRSFSWSLSVLSDSDILTNDNYKIMYAL